MSQLCRLQPHLVTIGGLGMADGLEGLSAEQHDAVTLFREVTASARDMQASKQLLASCSWNVEQALQLHWAHSEEDDRAPPPAAPSNTTGNLAAPLLAPSGRAHPNGAAATHPAPAAVMSASSSFVNWIASGVRRVASSLFNVFCTFLFGPGGPQLGGGHASGAAFRGALTNAYGPQLELLNFFEGGFNQALQTAQRELKLLVVYLHSEHARHTQGFCTEVLSNDFVTTMLNESFVLWGGDVARMESHRVAMMIHARSYPCFCVLLPASIDEVRVVGTLNGEMQVDAVVALLTHCLEEMESHRTEIVARREQQAEDRYLREEQDREYQQALEMDRKREEERQAVEREAREAQRLEEEQRRKEEELIAQAEATRREVEEQRRAKAATLEPEGADATARMSLRLPAGQRLQRKFRPNQTLADVYTWAECVAFLPENKDRGLEVPPRFLLKTSFPSRDLVERERTIEELQLSGTQLLLAEIEDDD